MDRYSLPVLGRRRGWIALTSLNAFSRDILVAPAGKIAEATGWPLFFLATIVAGLPRFLLLPVFAPWRANVPLGARSQPSAADATSAASG